MELPTVELETFEPLQRARSNTWPLPRPENFDEATTPPGLGRVTPGNGLEVGAGGIGIGELPENVTALDVKCSVIPELMSGSVSPGAFHCSQLKKGSSRRNAWGNLSYADLITQAITSSPENRLTLSQIYEWMVQNVPYFKDKGDNNSSAGWKNSIRHNLSLHNRFMRVQNEGTGKSSWWMLNPDAKPGKSTRRRATSMETSKFEKRRGRVKKKVDALRNGVIEANVSPSSSVSETVDLFPEFPESPLLYQPSPDFRTRASSNASSCSRLSPIPAVETEWTLNYQNYVPADQLAGSLEQRMKINNGSGAGSNGEPYLQFSTYQPQSPQSQQQAQSSPNTSASGYSRTTFSQVTTPSSSQNCLLHPLQPCSCTFLTDLKPSLSPIVVSSSNSSPASHLTYMTTMADGSLMDHSLNLLDDLNINIESFQNDFECNVDEVIRHELSIGGSLDFNFSAAGANGVLTSTPSSQTSSAAAAAAAATTAAAAAATSNRGQASYNDRSWVH